MAKRSANTELNHDNWDQEEAPEEAGIFKKAVPEVIEKRVIRTAKRRIGSSPMEEKKAFTSFSGFGGSGSTASVETVKPTFGFLANTNGVAKEQPKAEETKAKRSETDEKKSSYYQKLKELNEGVLEWITMHVTKDPYCILTPVFKDYENYLDTITSEKSDEGKKESEFSGFGAAPKLDSKEKSLAPPPVASSSTFKIGDGKSSTPGFPIFGVSSPSLSSNKLNPDSSTLKLGAFGTGTTSGFSFSSDKSPFSFGGSVTAPPPSKAEQVDDEKEEVPVNDFKLVKEEDSVFSQRVKVFVKKDKAFGDRGVGTLYVKPTTGGKHQVIVRADTSLGNILLNILLSDATPTQRVGKNNVMLVCIPTPEAKPPPTPVLLRVKTEQEADNLLAKLDRYKDGH